MSQQIIVLGMHRSYTTLLATWLHTNGIQMFDPQMPPPPHWEDPEILRFHEEFLKSQNMNWMNARAPFVDPLHTYRNRAFQLWQQRDQQFPYWGWKDPRTCILYDFLWSSFADSARFIVVYRHPAEVLESLLTRKIYKRTFYRAIPDSMYSWYTRRHRNQYDVPHLIAWNYYNRCILQLLSQKHPGDYVVLNAQSLVDLESQIVHRLTEIWQIPLRGISFRELIQPSTLRETAVLKCNNTLLCEETAQILDALSALQSFKHLDAAAPA